MKNQIEITENVKLLENDGKLAVKGWARHNLFDFDRASVHPRSRLKEWDFYQISDGKYIVQINFFNITFAAVASANIVNMETGKRITSFYFVPFTRKRFSLPRKSDTPNFFRFERNGTVLQFDTRRNKRKLEYSGLANGKKLKMQFTMDIMPEQENITTVTPFKDKPKRFFMTTKQNCMPCEGSVVYGKETITFNKDNTFAVLDWGRGVWPRKNFWYWGNGSARIDDKLFGFEVTWGIGDDSEGTPTCLFYDGKAHKISAVKIEQPPQKRWMEPWHIISDDGRFDVTMTPTFINKIGAIILGIGMTTHQVHGLWNGYAILDDGKKIEIKDMFAFCEYVENSW